MCFVHPVTGQRRERQRLAAAQLVGLGQQDVGRQAAGGAAVQQLTVQCGQRMADIHQQQQTAQGGAFAQIPFQQGLPVAADRIGHLGVAVAGQIHQIAVRFDGEKVQQLGAARGFADPGQPPLTGQDVESAGFAGVGATGERHFLAGIGRQLREGIDAVEKVDGTIAAGGRAGRGNKDTPAGVSH